MCCAGFALAVICISQPVDQSWSETRLLLCVSMHWCLHYSASACICSTYAALLFRYTPYTSLLYTYHCSAQDGLHLSFFLPLIIISPDISMETCDICLTLSTLPLYSTMLYSGFLWILKGSVWRFSIFFLTTNLIRTHKSYISQPIWLFWPLWLCAVLYIIL